MVLGKYDDEFFHTGVFLIALGEYDGIFPHWVFLFPACRNLPSLLAEEGCCRCSFDLYFVCWEYGTHVEECST